MKSIQQKLRKISIGVFILIAGGVLLSACQKNDNDNIDIPAAALMAFNLSPDKEAIGVNLSGNSISPTPLNYTAFTGRYINIYPGNRTIDAYDYFNRVGFASSTFDFEQDKYYSLFVVGADTVFNNIVVEDNFDGLSGSNGKAYLRFVNAIPDSSKPVLTATAAGQQLVNEPRDYASVSAFKEVTPGKVAINFSNNGNINVSREIDVQEKKAYTVLLLGKPGSTDSDKSIQIRFIENGTLSDSTAAN